MFELESCGEQSTADRRDKRLGIDDLEKDMKIQLWRGGKKGSIALIVRSAYLASESENELMSARPDDVMVDVKYDPTSRIRTPELAADLGLTAYRSGELNERTYCTTVRPQVGFTNDGDKPLFEARLQKYLDAIAADDPRFANENILEVIVPSKLRSDIEEHAQTVALGSGKVLTLSYIYE